MTSSSATSAPWTTDDLPDLTGTTVIVTGANSGIGLAAARALSDHGARVVLAVRDLNRGADAARSLSGDAEVRRLDLADLASVREFAAGWSGPIHTLVNNAGIMAPPLSRTVDGFESQFGTNHLGHFALTNLLLPQVTGRVVTISSLAHRAGKIDFDDLHWTTRTYRRWEAYGQSKLANLLFTLELQRRLTAAGSPVLSMAAHPGWAATNLQARSTNRVYNALMTFGNRMFAQDADGGALPTLYAATADLPGGSFAGPSRRGGSVGPPTLSPRSAAASDTEVAARLWTVSEQLTGVTAPTPSGA
ncbi:MAG: SDR family NAD(P)-dependent oxidoreductase [Burkholderiaceae bacterium]|nr:SDR family NAD(P)-dependent oxidoreductase [Microbacteriaceae bacterium]